MFDWVLNTIVLSTYISNVWLYHLIDIQIRYVILTWD